MTMQKKVFLFLLLTALSLTLVSAFSFNDFFGKITGKVVSASCTDSDVNSQYSDGFNYYLKGTASKGSSFGEDSCFNANTLRENYCSSSGNVDSRLINCPSGFSCSNGACISPTNAVPPVDWYSCTDSDNGADYTKRGIITYKQGRQIDIMGDDCYEGIPSEFKCEDRQPVRVYTISVCSTSSQFTGTSCFNGRCIPVPEINLCELLPPEIKSKILELKAQGKRVVMKEGEKVYLHDYVFLPNSLQDGFPRILAEFSSVSIDSSGTRIFTLSDALVNKNYKSDTTGGFVPFLFKTAVYNPSSTSEAESLAFRWTNIRNLKDVRANIIEDYTNCLTSDVVRVSLNHPVNPSSPPSPAQTPVAPPVTNPPVNNPPAQACEDTDGGKNYYVKGTATDNSTSKVDNCINIKNISEYYCINNKVEQSNYLCPNGCSEGKCTIPPETPAAPTTTTTSACIDSDGLDYNTKGTATWTSTNYVVSDFCGQQGELKESICTAAKVDYSPYNCEFNTDTNIPTGKVCRAGRCLSIEDINSCSTISDAIRSKANQLISQGKRVVAKEGEKVFINDYVLLPQTDSGTEAKIFQIINISIDMVYPLHMRVIKLKDISNNKITVKTMGQGVAFAPLELDLTTNPNNYVISYSPVAMGQAESISFRWGEGEIISYTWADGSADSFTDTASLAFKTSFLTDDMSSCLSSPTAVYHPQRRIISSSATNVQTSDSGVGQVQDNNQETGEDNRQTVTDENETHVISFCPAEFQGLSAYYNFDDDTFDLTNGRHGRPYNISFRAGILKDNDAVSFAGNKNSYILLPKDILDDKSQFSVSLWLKSSGSGDGIFSVANSRDDNEFLIYDEKNPSITFKGRTINLRLKRADYLNDNEWHNIIVTADSGAGILKIYVDGVMKKEDKKISKSIIKAEGIVLGQDQDGVLKKYQSWQSYRGEIDELSIFSRVLSAGEVSQLYNSGRGTNACELV